MPRLKSILILIGCAIFGCRFFSAENAAASDLLDYDLELAARLLEKENALLLDIRTQAEFDLEHIEGAAFIPFLDFPQYLTRIGELTNGDRTHPIVLYCRTGRRAGIVKKVLIQEGYTRVTNMGGLGEWRKKKEK
jgi:rhodanese-related sulfurtransferase